MRKVVVSEFVTLDGVIEAPDQWQFPFWNDETAKFKREELFAADAQLLGRVTFEAFAAAWPTIKDDDGFADRFNSMPKFVASTTLKEPLPWNGSLLKGNLAQGVSALKQQPGQDIVIYGGAGLVHSLMKENLIDEFRLLVYPIVLGRGLRLFAEGSKATLKLVEQRPMGSDVMLLIYQPAETKAQARG
jgi:dihydrofolate reductase